jgi:hypothetical protein
MTGVLQHIKTPSKCRMQHWGGRAVPLPHTFSLSLAFSFNSPAPLYLMRNLALEGGRELADDKNSDMEGNRTMDPTHSSLRST